MFALMFYQPRSLDEALALKSRLGPDATFIAGGTDVIVLLNHGRLPAKAYIDLTHVPGQDFIESSAVAPPTAPNDRSAKKGAQASATYRAGGGATFAQLGKLPVRSLAEASLSVGGPQIRNRGTIAGNIASASPAGDGSTALLALDAVVEMRSTRGSREIPLREFFLDYRKTALAPEEMITAVRFAGDWQTGWYKLGKRGAMNISLVCCAVGLSPEGKFQVAFGSVGPYPLVAPKTEEFLTSGLKHGRKKKSLDAKTIDEAAKLACEEVRPIDDFRGSATYRRAMSGVLLKKALRQMGLGKERQK